MTFLFIFIFLIKINYFVYADRNNPGHLKPFGSVGSLINIKELNNEFPTIVNLFTYYIPKSETILLRQVLTNDNHYSLWRTDEELENNIYGLSNTNIQVQSFRFHQQQRIEMTFKEFFQRYRKEPLLFIDNVPEILQKYLVVPKPLQCEITLETFHSAILVIHGINASPLMFGDEYDHFHCVLRGNKRFVLINTNKYPDVREKRKTQRLPVNPDRVDFEQFPELSNVDYHIANLTSGDCLFIPSNWVFQERSFENIISVVYNIKHQHALNIDKNQLKTCPSYDKTFTLDQIDWSVENHPQTFRDLIINLVNSNVEGFDKWQKAFSKHLSYDLSSDPETSSIFEEFYGIIDVDGDGKITKTEIEQINGAHQHHITDILYEISKITNTKRKSDTSKSFDEIPTQQIENENEIHELLHLQNYKTDL